jgi:threonine dehydratase
VVTPINESDIARARALIDPIFLGSPLVQQETIDERLGCEVALKVETLNPIRSFKGRGTEALMASLQSKPSHVVTTSSGNFGQGVARAATKRGIQSTIFSADDINPGKLAAMRRLGAEVRLVPLGEDFKAAARQAALEMGAFYIEDGAHPEIAAGAGTIGMELVQQAAKLDAVLVQIGDGALVTGVGSWIKAASPGTRVIGVTAKSAPAMRKSLAARKPVSAVSRTIADGMAIDTPIASAVNDVAAVVDDIIEVEEDALLDAMALLLQAGGLVAEPSGAAGLAAIMRNREVFRGLKVATIVTGGNARPELLAEAAARINGRTAEAKPEIAA